MKKLISMLAVSMLVAVTGCMQRESKSDALASRGESFTEQAEKGQRIYNDSCARCHGELGEGTRKGPRLIGLSEGALPLDPPADRKWRDVQFRTAADVGRFSLHYMPPLETGSLTEDAFLRLLAFELKANGIDLGERHLDMRLAEQVEIPRVPMTSQR